MHLIEYYNALRLGVAILVILSSIQSHSTTAVVIVSSGGIVVAVDSKLTGRVGSRAAEINDGIKVFSIQNRIAIVGIGREIFHVGKDINYDFGTWVHSIESSLPDNVSFDDFVLTVNAELRKMIPKWQTVLSSGGMDPEIPEQIFELGIEYVIAGYQGGIPKLCVLKFYIDWDAKKVVGPYQVPRKIIDQPHAYFFGVLESLTDLTNGQSYAYKQAMSSCPETFQKLISDRPVTLDETAAFARTLVGIEEQTNPSKVGGKVRGVEILPNGRARDMTETDIGCQAKTKTGGKAKESMKSVSP